MSAATAVFAQVSDTASWVAGGDKKLIFTTRGRHDAWPGVGASAGKLDREKLASDISGRKGRIDYRLDYAVQAPRETGSEPEAMSFGDVGQQALGPIVVDGRLGWQLGATQRLELSGSLANEVAWHSLAVPAGGGPRHTRMLGTAWLADWSDRYRTRVAIRRSLQYHAEPTQTRTQWHDYVFENRWKLGHHALMVSVAEGEDLLLYGAARRSHGQQTFSLGHVYERRAHRLDLDLGYVRDSEFGHHASGKLSWGYDIVPQLRFSAVAGSSAQVPTLYQRLNRSGPVGGHPEKNRRVELHLDWERDAQMLGLVVYRRHIRDLVSLVPADLCQGLAGCVADAGGTQRHGVTLSGKRSLGRFDLSGSLDLQRLVDADSRLLLPHHARRVLKLDGSTRVGPWQIGPQWQLIGRRFADTANHNMLAGYGRLDVQASASFAPAWELTLRVDNATDRNYRLTNTQTGPGRVWRVQLRWVPR